MHNLAYVQSDFACNPGPMTKICSAIDFLYVGTNLLWQKFFPSFFTH